MLSESDENETLLHSSNPPPCTTVPVSGCNSHVSASMTTVENSNVDSLIDLNAEPPELYVTPLTSAPKQVVASSSLLTDGASCSTSSVSSVISTAGCSLPLDAGSIQIVSSLEPSAGLPQQSGEQSEVVSSSLSTHHCDLAPTTVTSSVCLEQAESLPQVQNISSNNTAGTTINTKLNEEQNVTVSGEPSSKPQSSTPEVHQVPSGTESIEDDELDPPTLIVDLCDARSSQSTPIQTTAASTESGPLECDVVEQETDSKSFLSSIPSLPTASNLVSSSASFEESNEALSSVANVVSIQATPSETSVKYTAVVTLSGFTPGKMTPAARVQPTLAARPTPTTLPPKNDLEKKTPLAPSVAQQPAGIYQQQAYAPMMSTGGVAVSGSVIHPASMNAPVQYMGMMTQPPQPQPFQPMLINMMQPVIGHQGMILQPTYVPHVVTPQSYVAQPSHAYHQHVYAPPIQQIPYSYPTAAISTTTRPVSALAQPIVQSQPVQLQQPIAKPGTKKMIKTITNRKSPVVKQTVVRRIEKSPLKPLIKSPPPMSVQEPRKLAPAQPGSTLCRSAAPLTTATLMPRQIGPPRICPAQPNSKLPLHRLPSCQARSTGLSQVGMKKKKKAVATVNKTSSNLQVQVQPQTSSYQIQSQTSSYQVQPQTSNLVQVVPASQTVTTVTQYSGAAQVVSYAASQPPTFVPCQPPTPMLTCQKPHMPSSNCQPVTFVHQQPITTQQPLISACPLQTSISYSEVSHGEQQTMLNVPTSLAMTTSQNSVISPHISTVSTQFHQASSISFEDQTINKTNFHQSQTSTTELVPPSGHSSLLTSSICNTQPSSAVVPSSHPSNTAFSHISSVSCQTLPVTCQASAVVTCSLSLSVDTPTDSQSSLTQTGTVPHSASNHCIAIPPTCSSLVNVPLHVETTCTKEDRMRPVYRQFRHPEFIQDTEKQDRLHESGQCQRRPFIKTSPATVCSPTSSPSRQHSSVRNCQSHLSSNGPITQSETTTALSYGRISSKIADEENVLNEENISTNPPTNVIQVSTDLPPNPKENIASANLPIGAKENTTLSDKPLVTHERKRGRPPKSSTGPQSSKRVTSNVGSVVSTTGHGSEPSMDSLSEVESGSGGGGAGLERLVSGAWDNRRRGKGRRVGSVRPEKRRILTHLIDNHVIYESNKPFPVKRGMEVVEAVLLGQIRSGCKMNRSESERDDLSVSTDRDDLDTDSPGLGTDKRPSPEVTTDKKHKGSSQDSGLPITPSMEESAEKRRRISDSPAEQIDKLPSLSSSDLTQPSLPPTLPMTSPVAVPGIVFSGTDSRTVLQQAHIAEVVSTSGVPSIERSPSHITSSRTMSESTGGVYSMAGTHHSTLNSPKPSASPKSPRTLQNMPPPSPTTVPQSSVYLSRSIQSWTVNDVFEFVRQTPGCQAYAVAFRTSEIDGEALLLLQHGQLMKPPISMKVGPALKLAARIEEHK